jgi:hypothetical protein
MGAGEQKKFLVEMSLADPIEAKQMNDAVELAQKTTGVFFGEKKTAEAIMRFAVENPEKILEFQQNIEELKNAEEINITVATKILGPNLAKALGEKSVGEYLKKYNKQNKVVFLSQFQQTMTMLQEGDTDMLKSYNKWNAENGFKKTYADYAAWQSDRTVTAQGIDNTPAPGEGGATEGAAAGPQASILDQFVQMARETSNFQQKLTTGWSASYAALKNYTVNSINLLAGWAVRLKQQGVSANMIDVFMGATEEEQDRILDKRTGKLKAGALALLQKLQVIQDKNEFGLSYVLASATERMSKDNALYQAGLDVISNKEKKINDKYDKRIKALDEIGKLQEKSSQQQQDTLTLADALSKGDIAAAARAAMTAKQNNQARALEEAKEAVELARKQELADVTTIILGKTVDRDKLEAQIAVNSGKIAEHKRIELNRQIEIGKNAVIAADASARLLASGKLISKLPGANTPKGTGGTQTGVDDGKEDGEDESPKPTMSGVLGSLKDVKALVGSERSDLSTKFGKLNLPTAKADYLASQGRIRGTAKDGITSLISTAGLSTADTQDFSAALINSDEATITKLRGKLKPADKLKFDKLYKTYKNTTSNIANPEEAMEAQKNKLFGKLPKEVQSAFTFLKQYAADMKPIQEKVNDARTALKDFLETNPEENQTEAEKTQTKKLRTAKTNAEKELTTYKLKDDEVLSKLTALGYGANARKLFAGYARGGMVVPTGFALGGGVYGTDTVPAMLTPGEFVIRKSAVDEIGSSKLNAMNSGASMGESVYNYSITVNANSSDSSDIADAVLRQIKRVDSQRLRSNVI